jgi:spore maturation protein SpmA
MNKIFFGIIAVAFAFTVWNGTPAETGKAAMDSAKAAIELALGLVGYISLFLGLMKVVEEAGGLTFMARIIRPVMVRLFPDVPPDHPAMGAMIMNLAANVLGLGNAATPFGLKAMSELETLNKEKGTATNAMVLFLAINTSGVAVLPTGIIGIRAAEGSADPAAIFPTTLLATAINTVLAVVFTKFISRTRLFPLSAAQTESDAAVAREAAGRRESDPVAVVGLVAFLAALIGLVTLTYVYKEAASAWILPGLIMGMLLIGVIRGVKVYEVFIKGAKEGFTMATSIMPYLVAILVAVGMLRASGGLGALTGTLGPYTEPLGMPGEVLPLAFLRPLSGSGAFGLTTELIKSHGPDSYIGQLASTLNGSSETTFYVLAVYFGSIGIIRSRHAVVSGLSADIMGVIGSIIAVKLILG